VVDLSKEVEIIETKKVPTGATLIFAFPDVGLVGVIAASHLVDELGLTEVAHMDSDQLPPLIVLHEGLPHSSIRIFAGQGQDTLLAVSEVPIPTDMIYPIMDALINWGKSKDVKMMISLSGMPIQDRQDVTELKSFAAASTPEALKTAQEKGLEILTDGYMVGPQAVVLQRAAQAGSPAITLLAQCFYNYPDPEAAAQVLKELAKITGLKVNVAKLLEKGEEIRLRARDVMKRTQEEMSKMKKGQEYDIPMYVS
jgi:uncharacterized protein